MSQSFQNTENNFALSLSLSFPGSVWLDSLVTLRRKRYGLWTAFSQMTTIVEPLASPVGPASEQEFIRKECCTPFIYFAKYIENYLSR